MKHLLIAILTGELLAILILFITWLLACFLEWKILKPSKDGFHWREFRLLLLAGLVLGLLFLAGTF